MNITKNLLTTNFTKGRKGYDGKKNFSIEEITIHHAAGNITLATLRNVYIQRGISAHYGVRDTDVLHTVLESNTAWTNGSEETNSRAVTIEVCNSGGAPEWPVSQQSLVTLIELVYDIAKRNNLLPLVKGKSLTWHSMYSPTACPGPYLTEHLDFIVESVNELATTDETDAKPGKDKVLYRVRSNWDDITTQTGAFHVLENAQKECDKQNATPQYKVFDEDGKVVYPK